MKNKIYVLAITILVFFSCTNIIAQSPGYDVTSYIDRTSPSVTTGQNLTELSNKNIAVRMLSLGQNYPNPFNPSTNVEYSIDKDASVQLIVYNIIGKEIKVLRNTFQTAGNYSVTWDGTDNFNNPVSSGIYFYKLETDNQTLIKKMTLLR